jgi:hypothetical protein
LFGEEILVKLFLFQCSNGIMGRWIDFFESSLEINSWLLPDAVEAVLQWGFDNLYSDELELEWSML